MENCKKKLIVVAGPTAVGKSNYAIELAKKYNGEIISLDSVQVYKYLNIGSGKITKEEMNGIPHYMIDEVEPNINLNVKQFKDMAYKYINYIYEKNKIPILVGGTGFYIRAIIYDTDFLFEDDKEVEKIRDELNLQLKNEGIEKIFEMLKKVDSESAMAIPKENGKRIIRALEFYKIHNIPISEHNKKEKQKESPFDFEFYVLNCDREKLYAKINNRVDEMLKKGFLDEVQNLIDMGIDKNYNSMKSIGYSELYDYIVYKNNNLEETIELIKQHTRNYAKRQLTWFKAQKDIQWKNIL